MAACIERLRTGAAAYLNSKPFLLPLAMTRLTKFQESAYEVVGNDEKQMQGYKERSDIREIIGDRLAREILLEPKKR